MDTPKYWSTEKGLIIELITKGDCEFYEEILRETCFNEKKLKLLLSELYSTKDIYRKNSAYRVPKELFYSYKEYLKTHSQKRTHTTIENIKNWIDLHEIEASLDKDHFFLEGRHLDAFIKFILDKACSEVLIVNPYVGVCDLSQTLSEATARGLKVSLYTQKPKSSSYYYEDDDRCHDVLRGSGVVLNYDPDVHAKLVIVDDEVAIVSSMNFNQSSSAGKTWEAGLVTIDGRVINSIRKAVMKESKI